MKREKSSKKYKNEILYCIRECPNQLLNTIKCVELFVSENKDNFTKILAYVCNVPDKRLDFFMPIYNLTKNKIEFNQQYTLLNHLIDTVMPSRFEKIPNFPNLIDVLHVLLVNTIDKHNITLKLANYNIPCVNDFLYDMYKYNHAIIGAMNRNTDEWCEFITYKKSITINIVKHRNYIYEKPGNIISLCRSTFQ